MKMKTYQANVTATLHENRTGTHVIWIDDENQLHVTLDGIDEILEKGTKEHTLVLREYAPIFLQ
jgi:ribose 5-phosphate isomerase